MGNWVECGGRAINEEGECSSLLDSLRTAPRQEPETCWSESGLVKKEWTSEMTGIERVSWAIVSFLEDLIMEVWEHQRAMERQGELLLQLVEFLGGTRVGGDSEEEEMEQALEYIYIYNEN